MPFDIRIDYRFDSTGFFDDPDRRAALDFAIGIWEDILEDEFDDVPAGIAFEIDDPSAAGTARRVVLDEAIDDLLIFVGAEQLTGPLALGGYDGTGDGGQGLGDAYSARISGDFRGTGPVTDFEPWAGTVSYDVDADWSFAIGAPEAGRPDFVSVTLHEIGHVLGFGTAPIFDAIGAGQSFDGPNARAVNGGDPIPLQVGLGHVENGFAMDSVLMDPSLQNGTRLLPSDIDRAMLADIGWEIAGFDARGATPPIATEAGETIFGSAVADAIDGLGGGDQIQGRGGDDAVRGGDGDDTLFGGAGADTLEGGAGDDQIQGGDGADLVLNGAGADTVFGQGGADLFRIAAGGGSMRIQDFDLASEVIELEGSGLASAAAAVAAVTKPFGNVSRLTFVDGTQVEVFHDSGPGTPLTEANFALIGPSGPGTIAGGDGPDRLEGTGADERLLGLGGDDTLEAGGGDDTLDGGAGADRLVGGPGDDRHRVDDRGDRVVEAAGEGRDTVEASVSVTLRDAEIEAVVLTGAAAARVTGNGAATEIAGNGAANVLIGGGGGDVLTGNGGADVFAFLRSDLPGPAARITDFSEGDRIALDDRLFGLGDGGVEPRDVTQAQVRAAVENGRALYDGRAGELSVDLDGRGGADAPRLLAVIEGGGPLSAEDLLLF